MARDPKISLTLEALGRMGVVRADAADVLPVHRLATGLLGEQIASAEMLSAMREHNPETLYVRKNTTDRQACAVCPPETWPVTAFLALLPLTPEGVAALWDAAFDPLTVDRLWVCPWGNPPHAIYVWGIGGVSLKDRATIWGFARFLENGLFGHVAHYARPGTQRGCALMEQRGFRPLASFRRGAPETIWMRPALNGLSSPPGGMGTDP